VKPCPEYTLRVKAPEGAEKSLTIALLARANMFPGRDEIAKRHGFALEYTPDPEGLQLIGDHVRSCHAWGMPVRYHAFLPDWEIAHTDAQSAERAVQKHIDLLGAVREAGGEVTTLHMGLVPDRPLDLGRGAQHLSRLAEFARGIHMTLLLENLRRGPLSDPGVTERLARNAGVGITLDVGHAVSNELVIRGERSALSYLNAFSSRTQEAHVYGYEADRHYPITDIRALAPVLRGLLRTDCTWWTIELDDLEEALKTRRALSTLFSDEPL
jgi:sugar phosphate isomerase/epimerase